MNITVDHLAQAFEELRRRPPLVHHITNYVVMNFTANALLALGASPVMAHAIEEVEEMAGLADAVVLNLGTLSSSWIDAMFLAARAAAHRRLPVVLDPVGAGATRLRTEAARRLLETGHVTVVRANASEVLALAGKPSLTRGVDAADSVASARDAARSLADNSRVVVAMTGPEDFVTDGARSVGVANGHPLMARVTGTGCVASSISGAFCARAADRFVGAVGALVAFGIAGEMAARRHSRPGSYATGLVDALDELTPEMLRKQARVNDLSSL